MNGGDIPVATKVTINEAKIAVEQALNRILKMEYLNLNIPSGEMIPNGASVATYENVLVEQYKNASKSKLPAMPLKLPRGIGIYEIFYQNDPDCLFIPMEMGTKSLLNDQPLINDLLGQVGYTAYGDTVVYTKDITLPNEDVYVTMRLVVLDVSQYDDWSLLPIPADMEAQVLQEVINLFRVEPISDKIVDPGRKELLNTPPNQQSQP